MNEHLVFYEVLIAAALMAIFLIYIAGGLFYIAVQDIWKGARAFLREFRRSMRDSK